MYPPQPSPSTRAPFDDVWKVSLQVLQVFFGQCSFPVESNVASPRHVNHDLFYSIDSPISLLSTLRDPHTLGSSPTTRSRWVHVMVCTRGHGWRVSTGSIQKPPPHTHYGLLRLFEATRQTPPYQLTVLPEISEHSPNSQPFINLRWSPPKNHTILLLPSLSLTLITNLFFVSSLTITLWWRRWSAPSMLSASNPSARNWSSPWFHLSGKRRLRKRRWW